MRLTIKILVFMLGFVLTVDAQSAAAAILLPAATDAAEAKAQNLEVFKILPRGLFESGQNELAVRGGGAYYSFVKKSHNYNEIPQIELQKGNLSVAFYGANYGFIADLGKTPLAEVSRENKDTDFLFNYAPQKYETEAREEYRKIGAGFETGGLKYKQSQPAIVGHSYILRAISYREADTLVAFKVHRKDADGSLIIFWKLLQNFEKPVFIEANYSGGRAAQIEEHLRKKGFTEVKVSEENKIIVLRGRIPKGRLADVIIYVQELAKAPVKNLLTEE